MFCEEPKEVPEKRICRCKHCIFRNPDTVPWPEALNNEMAGKQKEPVKPIEEEIDPDRRSTIASMISITTNDELDKPRGTSLKGSSPAPAHHHHHHHQQPPTILLLVVNKPPEGYPGQVGCPGRCNAAGPPNLYNQPPPPGYGYGYNRTRYDPSYRDNRPPSFGAAYPDDGRGPSPNNWYQYGNAHPGNSPNGGNGQPNQVRTPDNYCRCLPTGGASRKRCGCKDEAAAKRRVCQCEAPPPTSPPPEKVITPTRTPPRSPPQEELVPPLETKQMGEYRCVSVPVCITHGKPACCDCCECDDQDDEDLEEQVSTCCCNNLEKCICLGPQGRQKPPACECNMTELERHLRHLMPNMECICFQEKPKKKRKKRKPPPPRKIYDRFANPPYVLEPKSCCLNRCRTVCCQPVGNSCYTQSYGGGCSPW
ncbi:uncharacterized protein Dwil_GK24703 [Drosophila willistoni]|uniref:Uncharacterized protein n=1 Tax=Drosophila willistoni TaxID=7260 RepID=B4MZR1_DROWI|nr:uncharacterized protein CG42266 [Drosophila willistoni]EDW77846.2 uncharacterized protein Dwil_GK24703 [Drosophila willistoni]